MARRRLRLPLLPEGNISDKSGRRPGAMPPPPAVARWVLPADQANSRPIGGGRMPSDRGIETGTEVEVRNRFTGEWRVGFEVVGCSNGVVRVRRLRDGAIIPAAFRDEEVRVCAPATGRS